MTAHTRQRLRLGLPLTATLAALILVSCTDEPPTEPTSTVEEAATLSASATAAPLSFYQMSGGDIHTCGVTADNRLYCWGNNNRGQLGDGTTIERHTPVPVAPELRFRHVSAGIWYTCAVTTGYQAYCWGYNGWGNLGDGTDTERLTPVPVAGGRQFRLVETYEFHTCAVTLADNRAYCWGFGGDGALGDGSTTSSRVPVAVAGTLRFHQVSVGRWHTCGVATDNQAYCWGNNQRGQLGDRTEVDNRTRPTLVADGHRFRQLDAGFEHNCAVRTDKRAFCWGNGRDGQIGNGKAYLSFWPRAVAGGLSFDRVTAALQHSCGETTLNRAYCWGLNGTDGRLGDGTTERRLSPVAVAGGHFFSQLSAGSLHTCGKTDAGKGYCWGFNDYGQIGDGTTSGRRTPTPVAGAS
jgi:alpha-tubulin suppressor-like RCC1 family protein